MRYQCIVAYDGYDYFGYQIQNHEPLTIQQVIQEALQKLLKEKICIYASGRTDRKVHALGQVFHFDTSYDLKEKSIQKGLNSFLPQSIRILKVNKVKDTFHARYDVVSKQYLYRIQNTALDNPFLSRYVVFIKEPIHIDLLNQAGQLFVGEHNFKNFTTNREDEVSTFIKKIMKVKVKVTKKEIQILFEGSGFLRSMVRLMVGAMLAVATQKKDLTYIQSLLDLSSLEKCSYKAPPQGLYLKKVNYGRR